MNKKHSILLIDNDIEYCKEKKELFEHAAFDVIIAHDREGALKNLCDSSFDLIVSNLRMPHLQGTEIMELVNTRGIDAPVIFLTKIFEVEHCMDVMNMGAFDYLDKMAPEKRILNVAKEAVGLCPNSS